MVASVARLTCVAAICELLGAAFGHNQDFALRQGVDVVVWFFLLGLAARLLGSDLRLPESLYEGLAIYLLLAIGLKGGMELSRQPIAALAPQIGACIAISFATPFLIYPLLRALRLPRPDAASIGAHFGSVSVVTFAVVAAAVAARGLPHSA